MKLVIKSLKISVIVWLVLFIVDWGIELFSMTVSETKVTVMGMKLIHHTQGDELKFRAEMTFQILVMFLLIFMTVLVLNFIFLKIKHKKRIGKK